MQRQRRRAVRQEGIRCQRPWRLLGNERREGRHKHVQEHRHKLEILSVRHWSHGRRLRRCLSWGHTAFTDGAHTAGELAYAHSLFLHT